MIHPSRCRSGGIGRRARFRAVLASASVGSSPTSGTTPPHLSHYRTRGPSRARIQSLRSFALTTISSLDTRILDLLGREGRPLGIRDIHHRLDLAADERRELKKTLRRLLDDGTLHSLRGARVGLARAHEPRGGPSDVHGWRLWIRCAREHRAGSARRVRRGGQSPGGPARRPSGGAR